MNAQQIRQQFLDFFESKGHKIVPSAPIVVKNDPTLMFTNAGMNQFKDYFLGNQQAPYKRVADTQKCLRVSGKHNDLEDVGHDTYHHTMFEMLGNWSFGDYFKKDAIAWAWELLTTVYKLDKDRLYVTVFEGDEKENLAFDQDAYNYWKEWIAEDRILRGNKKDNFWEMGDTGPCGPCSEIHYDMRPDSERAKVDGKTLVNNDDPQVIEIWNNVFMEFNRQWKYNGAEAELNAYENELRAKLFPETETLTKEEREKREKIFKKSRGEKHIELTSLQELPEKHVDTGMGFERLVRAIEGKASNYDSSVFSQLIRHLEESCHIKYNNNEVTDIAFRVIVDHIRAISFCIADGQLPSNTGAGYVVRRILRRAVRYGYSFLNLNEPFLHKLMHTLASEFMHVFPELYNQISFVSKVILEEEQSFFRTLETGINKFEEYVIMQYILGYGGDYKFTNDKIILDLNSTYLNKINIYASQKKIDKEWVDDNSFILKVAYNPEFLQELSEGGFSIKVTAGEPSHSKTIAGSLAFKLFDTYGFPIDLTQVLAKELSWSVNIPEFEKLLQQQKDRSRKAAEVSKDDWITLRQAQGDNAETEFVGYDALTAEARIMRYRKVSAKNKEFFQIVLDKTPFYAESGGQVGDTGYIQSANEKIAITDTQKENNLIIHIASQLPENPEAVFTARVDADRRRLIADNHSATHLLHAALKRVLGEHVNQKGSLVASDYLRFDFSHFAKMTEEEVRRVEQMVNQKIRENILLNEQRNIPIAKAEAQGATMLFGEKYGETVRVITFDKNYSMELCGGTHVPATGQIGFFKITAETSVAAGVRRIEAITADKAEEFIYTQLELVEEAKTLLNNPRDLKKGIEALLAEKDILQKRLEALENQQVLQVKAWLKTVVENIGGINFISRRVPLESAEAIKNLAFALRNEVDNLFFVAVAEVGGKPNITVMISDNVVKERGLDAGKIIRELAKLVKGGGGGQPFYATAGGSDISGLDAVVAAAKDYLG